MSRSIEYPQHKVPLSCNKTQKYIIFLSLTQSKDGPQGQNSGLDLKLIMALAQAIMQKTNRQNVRLWI